MATLTIFDEAGGEVGTYEIDTNEIAATVNKQLLHDVVVMYQANLRQGSHNTRTRGEVAGSTKKMYRQKGTGRARHGDEKATQFRGGGRAFGPKPRDYSYKPPKKMRKGALKSALALKLKEGRLLIVDSFELSDIKTKALAGVLSTLEVPKSSLIVDGSGNEKLRMSARNLAKHQYLPPEGVNVYDLLRHEHLILTKDAVEKLEARFNG